MAWGKDELMDVDVDVDRNEVSVDENEMDAHDVVQVEGRQRRLTAVAGNGRRWVMRITTVVVEGGGGCPP
ncbi:unnamed protein product [Sphagnum balticum]